MAFLNWNDAIIELTSFELVNSNADLRLNFSISGVALMSSFCQGTTSNFPSYFSLNSTEGEIISGELIHQDFSVVYPKAPANVVKCFCEIPFPGGSGSDKITTIFINFAYENNMADPSGIPITNNNIFGLRGYKIYVSDPDTQGLSYSWSGEAFNAASITPDFSSWIQEYRNYDNPNSSTAISSVSELANWNGSSNAHLTNNITITASDNWSPKALTTASLDGRGFSITISSIPNFAGLFSAGSGANIIISYCTIHTTDSTDPSIFSGSPAGNISLFYVNYSPSNGANLVNRGAICDNTSTGVNFFIYQSRFRVNIPNSKAGLIKSIANGTLNIYQSCIIAESIGTASAGCSINVQYYNIDRIACFLASPSGSDSSGMIYSPSTGTISNSYLYSTASGSSAGFYNTVSGNTTINNCYTYFSNTSGTKIGFVSSRTSGTITLNYCLTNVNNLVASEVSSTQNNCTSNFSGGSVPDQGGETFNTYALNNILIDAWDNTISSPNFPLLYTFVNSSGWGTYTNFSNQPTLDISGVCVVEGSLILTPRGYIPIQDIRNGDEIYAMIGTRKEIKKVIKKCYFPAYGVSYNIPYVVRANSLTSGIPFKDTYLSPGHAIYFNGKFQHPNCSNYIFPSTEYNNKSFNYHHICIDEYPSRMIVNGLEVETCGGLVKEKARCICGKDECKIWVE